MPTKRKTPCQWRRWWRDGWAAALGALLIAAQLLLVFASWLASALAPESGLRSLLDGEGMRWFFAHFTHMVGGPCLVWLLLLAVALGCMAQSGLVEACRHLRRLTLRQRSALSVATFVTVVYVALLAALTLPRRAVLAGIDGSLWPSPFSEAALPALALALCLASVAYGAVAGRLDTLPKAFASLHAGVAKAAPYVMLYILLAQLAGSLLYVLGVL